jgi:hypothetical protein
MSKSEQLTVGELIEKLSILPKDSPVFYFVGKRHKRFHPVQFVCHIREPIADGGNHYTFISRNEYN